MHGCEYPAANCKYHTNQANRRHVHSDLSTYVCTFDCNESFFEHRRQWLQHEMEAHRRHWLCNMCTETCQSRRDMEIHLHQRHSDLVQPHQIMAIAQMLGRPLEKLSAADCPFCDYKSLLELSGGVAISNQELAPEEFGSHVGRHLEQLALFVLPLQDLDEEENGMESMEDGENTSESNWNEEGTDEDVHTPPDVNFTEILAAAARREPSTADVFDEPPNLAMRWQPPQDFTPPEEDFDTNHADTLPLRQEPIYGGDLFTPGWARGPDSCREGYCARCPTGHWVNMTNGEYEYHMTYFHGVPRSGVPLPGPTAIQERLEKSNTWKGYCDACKSWKTLKRTGRGWTWYRHWLQVSSFVHYVGRRLISYRITPISFCPEHKPVCKM
jgi:hypothetical protein